MSLLRFVSENMMMSYEHFMTWRQRKTSGNLALSVVIPTCNDATQIISTTAAIAAHLSSSQIEFEILVTDGGSTDSTVERVRRLGLRNLQVLSPKQPRGKGASAKAGVLAARGNHILLTNAHLSTPIEHVDRLLAVAEQGGNIIVGGRANTEPIERPSGPIRRLCYGALRRRVGAELADPKRGFTLFDRESAHKLFAKQNFSGAGFDLEVLFRANNRRMSIVEVPQNWFEAAPALGDDPFSLPRKAVVTLPERFDRYAPSELAAFTPLLGERVCIDGSKVRHSDTIAIQSLIDTRLRFLDAGADLYITTPSNSLRITLELTGDDTLLKPVNEQWAATQREGQMNSTERIGSQHHERS